MITGVTRSRAAILCFGGWGLQTLLHLQPRLASIQRQREALGVEGPDLTRITSMAALLPSLTSDAVTLHLRRMTGDAELPPFYAEQLMAQVKREADRTRSGAWSTGPRESGIEESRAGESGTRKSGDGALAHSFSQQQSIRLLNAAESVLTLLDDTAYPRAEARHGRPVTRLELFQAGLGQGTNVARILDTHLISPIRQDNLAPGDPFVQTTLYVIAPLFEPLTSPLIWPSVIHLLNYLGRRHLSQIVGIFAAGSYAQDQSRALEDAASYAALSELEALTGLHPNAGVNLSAEELPPLLRESRLAEGEMSEWIGKPIFDRLYLLDREKANQGLVTNSFELSVMASNALEAMVTTDASLHIEEQLGIDLRNAQERPYSLMGAATDYLPVDYIFRAVQAQEEKRLVREVLLAKPDDAAEELGQLSDLGLAQEQILTRLVSQMPDLFAQSGPKEIGDLLVHQDFVLPPSLAVELSRLSPEAWADGFEERQTTVDEQFVELAGLRALEKFFGLSPESKPVRPEPSEYVPPLPVNRADDFVAESVRRLRSRLVELLAESPAGLGEAQLAVSRWRQALAQEQDRVISALASGRQYMNEANRQLGLRRWQGDFTRMLGRQPNLGRALLRTLLLLIGVGGLSWGYLFYGVELIFDRPADLMLDGGPAIALLLLTAGVSLSVYVRARSATRALRLERLRLAQQAYTARLQENVQRSMLRVYEEMEWHLRQMAQNLDETRDALDLWSRDLGMPVVPPSAVTSTGFATHLYVPHVSKRFWQLSQDHLQSQSDREGRQATERLWNTWRSPAWRRTLEALFLSEGSLLKDSPSKDMLSKDGLSKDRLKTDRGTAVDLSDDLHELLRQSVERTMAEINTGDEIGQKLVQRLAQECTLAHVIWRDPAHQDVRWQDGATDRGSVQNLIHRYLEALRSNAKPAANYEMNNQLTSHGITVDFAAVDGRPGTDLDDSTLREFRAALAPTSDPFRLTYVRTVHGLRLHDLDSMRRYRLELSLLPYDLLGQIALGDPQDARLYGLDQVDEQRPSDDLSQRMWM